MEPGDRGPKSAEEKEPSAPKEPREHDGAGAPEPGAPPAAHEETTREATDDDVPAEPPAAREASLTHEPIAAHEDSSADGPMAAHEPPAAHDESPFRDVRRSRPSNGGRASDGAVRRPRYLLVALIAALVFGAGCWTEGCARLAFYRGERDHAAAMNQAILDDGDREQAEQLYQRYIDTADATRGRGVPLAAATFVLGAALLALAARGLAGKSNTRSVLMQVVAAQAIVVAASFFATREMRYAEDDWQYQAALFQRRDKIPAEQYNDVASTLHAMQRWAPPAWLAFRSLASALIVLALSRPRSRAFFEAAARSVSDANANH